MSIYHFSARSNRELDISENSEDESSCKESSAVPSVATLNLSSGIYYLWNIISKGTNRLQCATCKAVSHVCITPFGSSVNIKSEISSLLPS